MLLMTASSTQAMEISREQCELVRGQLVASMQILQSYQNALKQSQFVALDLVMLKFEVSQIEGGGARTLEKRLQENIDRISEAAKSTLSMDRMEPEGALAFMKVCGPPPK